MTEVKIFETDDNILENVSKTFNKTEEALTKDVDEIIEWLETQHHLPEVMDKRLVRSFYIFNKCKIDRTKQKIENYYTIRSQSSDIFENINPKSSNLKTVMETLYFVPLPKLLDKMYRVVFFKVRDKNKIGELNPYDMLRYVIDLMELRLQEDVSCGDISIVDAKDLNMKFLIKLTPMFLYKLLVTVYEKVYSTRLRAVYIVNASSFLETVVHFLKKIIKPKLFQRFYVYKDSNIVHEKFPKDILPSDYGGSGRSLDELRVLLEQKFDEYQDRFDELDRLRVNEELRPNKAKSSKFFGIYSR